MGLTVTMTDDFIDELATAIAAKIQANGGGATVTEVEEDDFGNETPAELTLTDVQDAVKEAVGKHGKDKIKALVKKAAGVERVADIPKEKYQAVIDGLKKVK